MFVWRRAEEAYVVSLHGWKPFQETVAALRAVVDSLPRS